MNVKPSRLLVAVIAAAALPVFAQNVAVVNGKAIPSSRVDTMVKMMASQGQKDSPDLRAKIKEDLIGREIMMQEADKKGISNTADVKNQIELARQMIVIRALIGDFVKKNQVSDADIKAEYEKIKTQATTEKEYRARHILVDKEEDAKAIIAKLKGGAKFEDLAKQSKDAGSAPNGGDLDWNPPIAFVKPFSDAMVNLKKGEITETPVKTIHGYHVIRLDDIRPVKVPPLEEIKPQIAEGIQQQRLNAYQAELRKNATIK